MKKKFVLLAPLLIISLLLFPVSAYASETGADFSDVDWSTVDWSTIDISEWMKWLDEAELEALFQMSPYCDAGRAEGVASELGDRFRSDPLGMIMALTAENAEVRISVINNIAYNAQYYSEEFRQLLSGLTLPEDAGSDAMNILVRLVNSAEEMWNMDITNPHTGDPMGIAALLMAFSGLGTALLWKKRRIVA